jgi:hypothetical protein
MTYTRKLIEATIHTLVPYGDKIVDMGNKALGMNYSEDKKRISKRAQKARIATANAINKAVQEGRINASFKKMADNMKVKAQSQLAENNYQNRGYLFDQVSKAAPIADVFVPGLSQAVTTVYQVGTIQNLCEYASESPSYVDTAIKAATVVTPMIVGATSTLWMPFVTPWLGVAAAGVVGSLLVADGMNYLRG